jgi:hypothetical protein
MSTNWWATRWPAVPYDPALVWLVGPVVDSWTAVAPQTAPAQLGVELLEQPCRDLTDGHLTQRRLDVFPRVGLIALSGVLLDFMDPQPRVDGRTECRLGPGVLLRVDLCPETVQDAPRLGLIAGRLSQAKFTTGQGSTPAYMSTWKEFPRRRMCPRSRPPASFFTMPRPYLVTAPVTLIKMDSQLGA